MPSPYPEAPDPVETESDEPLITGEKVMGFLDHLEELRWTLVKCAIVVVLFTILSAVFLREVQSFLEWPWREALKAYPKLAVVLRTDTPMEVYSVMIQVCLPPAIAASVPFLLFFLGQFVSPALTDRERRVVRPVLLAAFALFLGGAAFAFLLLVRAAIEVAIEANDWMGYTMIWTAGSYYSLLNWLVLGMGLVCEFPLIVLALAYLGIVEVATFRKSRRMVIIICFIVAAVVTPTPDPFTQTLVAVPMWALFEISLIVATILVRRKARAEAAEEGSPAG